MLGWPHGLWTHSVNFNCLAAGNKVQETEVETAEDEELWVEINLENETTTVENEVTTSENEAATEIVQLSSEIETQPRRKKRSFKQQLKKIFGCRCCICGKKEWRSQGS